MDFLGHIIASECVEVDKKKTEVVTNCPTPFAPINIRSLFGLSGYYGLLCMVLHPLHLQ